VQLAATPHVDSDIDSDIGCCVAVVTSLIGVYTQERLCRQCFHTGMSAHLSAAGFLSRSVGFQQ
jgi:hypothetical protein